MNFFVIARGSVQECVPLLEVARRRGFIPPADHSAFKESLEEMSKMVATNCSTDTCVSVNCAVSYALVQS